MLNVLLMGALATASKGADVPDDTGEARRLAAIVADTKSSFDKKWEAAAAIKKCPPAQVYAAVFEHLADSSPLTIGIGWDPYPGKDLAKAPPELQSERLLNQIWYDMAAIAKEGRGSMVAGLLPKAKNDRQRSTVLTELGWDWSAAAEESVAALMRDHDQQVYIRILAAGTLVKHTEMKYYAEVRDTYVADKRLSVTERTQWFEAVAKFPQRGASRESDWDPKLLELGFGLLDEDMANAKSQEFPKTYWLASRLGFYVGMNDEFLPSQSDSKYRKVDGNLNNLFFIDTVRNAQKWWADNKERVAAHGARN